MKLFDFKDWVKVYESANTNDDKTALYAWLEDLPDNTNYSAWTTEYSKMLDQHWESYLGFDYGEEGEEDPNWFLDYTEILDESSPKCKMLIEEINEFVEKAYNEDNEEDSHYDEYYAILAKTVPQWNSSTKKLVFPNLPVKVGTSQAKKKLNDLMNCTGGGFNPEYAQLDYTHEAFPHLINSGILTDDGKVTIGINSKLPGVEFLRKYSGK
jgi:hypothetical protein